MIKSTGVVQLRRGNRLKTPLPARIMSDFAIEDLIFWQIVEVQLNVLRLNAGS